MTIGERHVRTGVTLAARNDGHRALAVAVPDPKQQGGRIGIARPQCPELIGANLRCGRLGWLDEYPATAAGCLVLVRSQPAPNCSHTHFVYADLGDRNCACAPPRPADCEGPGSKDVIGAVVASLYRAGGVDSEGVEKAPYQTSPAPVDVATEGLIPLRLIGNRRCGEAAWTLGFADTADACWALVRAAEKPSSCSQRYFHFHENSSCGCAFGPTPVILVQCVSPRCHCPIAHMCGAHPPTSTHLSSLALLSACSALETCNVRSLRPCWC